MLIIISKELTIESQDKGKWRWNGPRDTRKTASESLLLRVHVAELADSLMLTVMSAHYYYYCDYCKVKSLDSDPQTQMLAC